MRRDVQPLSGHVFIFLNRRRTQVKLLMWTRDDFTIVHRRLERAVPSSLEAFRAGKIDLTRTLLARRDLALARARRLDLIEGGWRAYADLALLSGGLP